MCMQPAHRHTHTHTHAHNILRSEIGWEWFYGKLLLNHTSVEGLSQSSAGMCKMIHDVSLFPWPRLQLPAHWSHVFCCMCLIQPAGREKNIAHPLFL